MGEFDCLYTKSFDYWHLFSPYVSHFPAELKSTISEYKSSQKFPMCFYLVDLSFCYVIMSQITIFSLVFGLSSRGSVLCYSTLHLTLRSRGIVLLCESQGKYILALPCLILCHFKVPLEDTFCRSIHPGLLPSDVIDVALASDLNQLSQSSIMTQ